MPLAGQDYNQVILVQMFVLACFPAVLYLLGKEFGSRPAGIMLALLTIFSRDPFHSGRALHPQCCQYQIVFFGGPPLLWD